MKKLFTIVSLMAFTIAINAQDPSRWEQGQNVAEDLGLKELGNDFSGTRGSYENGCYTINSIGNVWKGTEPTEYLPGDWERPAVFGFNGERRNFEFYQIVWVPAGLYTFAVNALYREGTAENSFKNRWEGKKAKNAHMFANIMAEDKVTVTYYNDAVIKSIADLDQHEPLYKSDDWRADYCEEHQTPGEDGDALKYYCPNCHEAFGMYFAEEHYQNTKKFLLTQSAYVKFGISKTGSISQDYIAFGNMKVIYEGPVDENSMRMLAEEELYAALDEMESFAQALKNAGFETLATLLLDYRDDIEWQGCLTESAEELVACKNEAIAAIELYEQAKEIVLQAYELISSCEKMISSTDFPGKNDFIATLGIQKAAVGETDSGKTGYNPVAYYNQIISDTYAARATYLNSQEVEAGDPKDYTLLIQHPWFVNDEYAPTNDLDSGGEYWHLTVEGWTDWEDPETYDARKTDRPDICSDVKISTDPTITSQWFKYQDYQETDAINSQLLHQGRLIGYSTGQISTLTNPNRPGISGVAQRLIGLPNGYYSVSCLVRGWDTMSDYNTLEHKFLGCFAENSENVRVSSHPSYNTDYWQDWGSSPRSWDNTQTSLVLVEDGKLLIGGGGSIANTVTGFRLDFYGETPDFAALALKKDKELRALISDDFFEGDKQKLSNILNSITHPVPNLSAYEAAFSTYGEFTDSLAKVDTEMGHYWALDLLPNEPETWLIPAITFFYEEVNTDEHYTYEQVDDLNDLADAYRQVYEMYQEIEDAGLDMNDAEIKKNMDEQKEELSKALSTKESLLSFVNSLQLLCQDYYTGIKTVKVPSTGKNTIYNIAGQPVGNDYKGTVIKNGIKILNR